MSEIRSKDSFVTSNPSFKLFKKSLKNYFNKPPSSFGINLIKNYDTIITSDEINILNMLNENEIEQLKKYDSKRLEISEDKILITNIDLLKDILIKNLTKCYDNIFNNIKNNSSTDSREYSYKNVKEIEEDIIMFSEENTLTDVLLNMFYNNDVEFYFNDKIKLLPFDTHGFVQSCCFNINNIAEYVLIPTKKKIICTAKNEFGVECGNIVEFCDIHIHSSIKCTDNLKVSVASKGHAIKNIDKANVVESRKFYKYLIKDISIKNNEDSREYLAYSAVPITEKIVKCNCILTNYDGEEIVFILAIKEEPFDREITENILQKNKNNITALDDIFESIKIYYKKYHNFKLNNKNKYIAKVIIFQTLTNIFFNERFHSFICGKSGSGKSIWAEIILPLFSFNYQYVIGTSVTENRLLGGQDKFKNYLPGYATTQDFVFFEESSTALNYYLDPNNKFRNSQNLFEMLKNATGKSYNTSQQNSMTCYPKASFILVGNLEHLNLLTQPYQKSVSKKYRTFSDGKNFDFAQPLFKSIEYYSKIAKDENLAKAHSFVRLKYYTNKFFMTGLPEAEQARFIFNVILEEVEDENKNIERMPLNIHNDNSKDRKVHRNEFLQELSFLKNYQYNKQFKKQIEHYFNDEFLTKRNNFTRNEKSDLNSHIKLQLFKVVYYFLVIEKLYWGEELQLTETDKLKVETFLKYNYNSLTLKESSEEKTPFVNDYTFLDFNDLNNLELIKNEEYFLKKKNELQEKMIEIPHASEEDIINTEKSQEEQDLGDIFGDL